MTYNFIDDYRPRLVQCIYLLHISISMCCYGHLEKTGKEEDLWFMLIATVPLLFNFAEFNPGYIHSTNTYFNVSHMIGLKICISFRIHVLFQIIFLNFTILWVSLNYIITVKPFFKKKIQISFTYFLEDKPL